MNNLAGRVQCRIGSLAFTGQTIEQTMEKINAHALKTLTTDDVFIFNFELSNTNIDAYSTRMTVDTLNNYANKINLSGVPLQGNHDGYTYPIGRIFNGEVVRTDDGVNRLECQGYIVRGDMNYDISSDALIKKIESGVQKDTSIGFLAGGYTCSICGGPMVDGWFSRAMGVDCDHIPGVMYEGKPCFAWVEDGTIIEGSLVYTGATPEAIIKKAVNAFKTGLLDAKMVNSVNKALQSNIVLDKPNPTGEDMKAKELLNKVTNGLTDETIKNSLTAATGTVTDEDTVEKGIEVLTGEVRKLESEIVSLRGQAAIGSEYKNTVVQEAMAEGVRAMGNDFDQDTMQKFLNSASIDEVKKMKNHYSKVTETLTGQKNLTDNADPIDIKVEGEEDKSGKKVYAEAYK